MWLTILEFVGGAACLIVALFEAKKRRKKKKVPVYFNWITLFGGLVVIGSVLGANLGTDKFQKDMYKRTDLLVGQNHGYIIFYGAPFKQGRHVCFRSEIIRMGELPIYDINITLLDLSTTIREGTVHKGESKAMFMNDGHPSLNVLVGSLSGGVHQLPLIVTPDDLNFYRFIIVISTRDGSVVQEQYFKKINGTWETASLLFESGSKTLLEKNLSTNFPQSVLDSIDAMSKK
jgi:hypothetical protein